MTRRNVTEATFLFFNIRIEVDRWDDESNGNRTVGFSHVTSAREREKNLVFRLGFHHPSTQFQSFSYTPVLCRRAVNYGSSGDMFVEKLGENEAEVLSIIEDCLETVTIEEQPRRAPVSCVRTVSPIVRQLKIRSRPSSSFNLHDRESTGKQTNIFLFFDDDG